MLIRDRAFYRAFFRLFAWLTLQNVITLSVNLADNLMLGAYREAALSGAAAANQIQFVYQQFLVAFGETVVILGSQYFGQGRADPIKRVSSVAMRFALGVSLCLFCAVTFAPKALLSVFTDDAAILQEGVRYLRIIRFTYPFFCIAQILLATLRATGVAHIAVILSLVSLALNCAGNFLLIYGRLGLPAMGVRGAALATLIARIFELAVLLVFIARRERFLRLRVRDYFRSVSGYLRDAVRVMLPVLACSAMWGFNSAAQNAILGHMDACAIAANSVASTLFLMVKSAAQGASSAATAQIGLTIGRGRMEFVQRTARTLQLLFVGIGAVAALLLFAIREPVLSLYALGDETRRMARAFLTILTFVMLPMSYQMPTNAGIIRGGGDTRYFMILDFVSIWLIVIPASYLAAFRLGVGAVGVMWLLNSDQFFKCVPAFIKCNFGYWARKLTREEA